MRLARLPAGVAPAALVAALTAACGGSPSPDPCALATAGAPWLAFASSRTGSYEIYVARADGTCPRPLTSTGATSLSPTWAHGRIAYASDRGGALRVWIHDLASGQEAPLDAGALAAAAPAFSPDGTRLAFEGRAPGASQVDVWVAPVVGGTPTRLSTSAADDTSPAWSPDGATVYFVSLRTGGYEVFSVSASGGTEHQVTSGSRIVGTPAPTPDGAALLFARTMSGSAATEVVRFELADGTTSIVTSAEDSEPAISRDGRRLAVRSFRYAGGGGDVVAVDAADGAHPVRVTAVGASDGAPCFATMPP